jgi:hypothetical protein
MFEAASNLLKITGDISDIYDLMKIGPNLSVKIARLKASQRMEIHRIEKWICTTSQISSHQASGARGLISLGADLAIVSGTKKGKLRSSLRSTKEFFEETGVNLGQLVSELGLYIQGSGSGHPTSAGFNGEGKKEDFESKILEIIRGKIK